MYYIGVDVGGTSVKLGLFDKDDNLIARGSFKTKTIEYLVDDLVKNIKKIFKENNKDIKDLIGIGMGFPGHVDGEAGIVVYSNNLIAHNFPLVQKIQEQINVPIRISNDANVAALGEFTYGKGKGVNNIVFVTLGTGIW